MAGSAGRRNGGAGVNLIFLSELSLGSGPSRQCRRFCQSADPCNRRANPLGSRRVNVGRLREKSVRCFRHVSAYARLMRSSRRPGAKTDRLDVQ